MAKRFIFTYLFCNDLDRMKEFYLDVLRLKLIWEGEETIGFKIGDHQLSIQFHPVYQPPTPAFSIQPGWQGGTEPRTSWSLECDVEDFNEIVQNVISHDVPTYFPGPTWKGYWSFPVLDPMNNTIEITCTATELSL